jgi:hypothetical protein
MTALAAHPINPPATSQTAMFIKCVLGLAGRSLAAWSGVCTRHKNDRSAEMTE